MTKVMPKWWDNPETRRSIPAEVIGSSPAEGSPTAHHSDGTFFFDHGLDVIRAGDTNEDAHTVIYVERMLRRIGVLRALRRAKWMP